MCYGYVCFSRPFKDSRTQTTPSIRYTCHRFLYHLHQTQNVPMRIQVLCSLLCLYYAMQIITVKYCYKSLPILFWHLIIIIGILWRAALRVISAHIPRSFRPPVYVQLARPHTTRTTQSPKPQWWGGSHDRSATGIEPATCRQQDERSAPQTTRSSGPLFQHFVISC